MSVNLEMNFADMCLNLKVQEIHFKSFLHKVSHLRKFQKIMPKLFSHTSDDRHRSYQPYHDDDEGYEGNCGYNYGYNPYRPPSGGIKGKVEQKYWHTKQTVIQKLGKEQDSYVVAGDSEVDARLEVRKFN